MENSPWKVAVSTTEFEELLRLPPESVERSSYKRFTETGQNFGGTLFAIDLTIRGGATLHLVGKCLPESLYMRKVVGSATTFVKEVNVYRFINEELLKLQQEKCLPKEEVSDPLPRYYGSRINAAEDDSLEPDDKAILLLQNLTVDGYRMGDRLVGLDLEHAKMVIRKLARFQATAKALRYLKPEVFKKVVDGKCSYDGLGHDHFIDLIVAHIVSFPDFAQYIDRVRITNERIDKIGYRKLLSEVAEPYASLSHNDLWVNNIMFQYASSDSNTPVDVKFFDFQTLTYSSLARDIILFLYSSLELALIENCVDELIALYYEVFIQWLGKLGCSTEAFSQAEFLAEVDRIAPTEIFHILLMLCVVCAEENEKLDASTVQDRTSRLPSRETYRNRVHVTLRNFVSRCWL